MRLFFLEQMKRKKEFGGVYNEKFLEQPVLREECSYSANMTQDDEIDKAIDEEEDDNDH